MDAQDRGADVNEMERIWRDKTDEQLLEAASDLEEYTEEGRQVILAEVERRGLEPPEPTDDEAFEEGEGFGEGEVLEESDQEQGEGEPLTCLRCDVELTYLGSKDFHEGRKWGVLGEIGHLFEATQSFDVYVCPRCGHIDFFAPRPPEGESPEEPPS